MIICEIIVHLLVNVQNNKRRMAYVLKQTRISYFIKIRPAGAELLHVDGQMDRQTGSQTDIRKLLAAFRNFANSPKRKVKMSISMP